MCLDTKTIKNPPTHNAAPIWECSICRGKENESTTEKSIVKAPEHILVC